MQNLYKLHIHFSLSMYVQFLFCGAINYWTCDQHGYYDKNQHIP